MSRTGSDGVLLTADTPAAFADTHLRRHLERHEHGDVVDAVWVRHADLVADGSDELKSVQAQCVEGGSTPQAVGKYLAGWLGGSLAEVVGFTFVMAGAGIVADPATSRWRRHPDGWFDRADLTGCGFVVPVGHPWADRPDVETLADVDAVVTATMTGLVATVEPLLDACRRLARVGKSSLWKEVVDGLGRCVAFNPDLPVVPEALASTARLMHAPVAPWRGQPRLEIVPGPTGDVYIAQKLGCCLVYTCRPPDVGTDDEELDEKHLVFRERFPDDPPGQQYCSTCSLRSADDCTARQLFWYERQALLT